MKYYLSTWDQQLRQMRAAEAMMLRMRELAIECGATFGEGAFRDEVRFPDAQSAEKYERRWREEFCR